METHRVSPSPHLCVIDSRMTAASSSRKARSITHYTVSKNSTKSMKPSRPIKSVFISSVLTLGLLGGLSNPSQAQSVPTTRSSISNPLSQLFEQLNSQISSWGGYLNKILSDQLQPLSKALGSDLNSAISDAMGAVGLPDPIAARESVEKIAQKSDSYLDQTELATNEVDRQITRAAIDSTLSSEGQERIQQQANSTQNSVDLVEQQAQAAQGEVVTQDVMKRMALQNAQISSVLGSLRADSLQAAQRQELTNVNLTNISRSIDGQNQAKQAEMVGTGLEVLRTTSRARLF